MAFDWLIRRKDAIFIDLGFGRYPTTTIETYRRLAGINPDIRVIGVEIDTERLLGAKRYEQSNVEFRLGGFNLHKEYGYNLIQTKRLLKRGFLIVK